MGQIKNTNKYPLDTVISGNETIIGSDFDEQGATKNYKLSTLAAYFTQYFNSQNQTVTITGDVSGGNGAIFVPTTAQPSIISGRPDAGQPTSGGFMLYLNADGTLTKLSWDSVQQIISEGGGSYVHPTYQAINIITGPLEVVSGVSSDTIGALTGATKKTIQDSTTVQKGVIRIATPSEYYTNSTTVAVPPDAIKSFVSGAVSGTTNTIAMFTSANVVGNSVIKQSGTKIGINTAPNPSAEALQVGGVVFAQGLRNSSNDIKKVFTTDGGEAVGSENISIDGGVIDLEVLSIRTGEGAFVIPSTRYKTTYVTYDGHNTGGTDSVTLPISPREGQVVYIFHESLNTTGTLSIHGPTTVFEFDPFTGFICYFNGSRWMVFPRITLNVG